jgi:hypothetical protein
MVLVDSHLKWLLEPLMPVRVPWVSPGYMDLRISIYEYTNIYIYSYMDIRILGNMDILISGYIDIWICIYDI